MHGSEGGGWESTSNGNSPAPYPTAEKRRSEKVIKTAKGIAIFRAIVKDGKGGVATGTKMEKAASFGDYLEKAETGSIGRALAALGFGTQFAPELSEDHRIVDSPVDRGVAAGENGFNGNGHNGSANGNPNGNGNGNSAVRKPNIAAGAVRGTETGPIATPGNAVRTAGTPAPATDESEANAAATEQQLSSIRKLCERLGKQEPEHSDTLSFVGAKELIGQLTQEYRSRKAS